MENNLFFSSIHQVRVKKKIKKEIILTDPSSTRAIACIALRGCQHPSIDGWSLEDRIQDLDSGIMLLLPSN